MAVEAGWWELQAVVRVANAVRYNIFFSMGISFVPLGYECAELNVRTLPPSG
jgi:hypothetical protein